MTIYFCVLDFEATCNNNNISWINEVIEFPSVLYRYDSQNSDVPMLVSEFQEYCQPEYINGEDGLTDFCKSLTGITQKKVDNAQKFPDVLNNHYQWLVDNVGEDLDNIYIVTCGNWDMMYMFDDEITRLSIEPPSIYNRFINLQDIFKDAFGKKKKCGLISMLRMFGLTFEGRHHSGIDDCRNAGIILIELIKSGYSEMDGYIQRKIC